MAVLITDLISRTTDSTTGRPVIGSLASPGKAIAASSINLTDVTNWTVTSVVHLSIYKTMVVAGVTVKDPTTQTDWKGILPAASVTVGSLTLTGGTDNRAYVAGDIVELTPTARWSKDLYDWMTAHGNSDGSLKTAAVQAALNLSAAVPTDYNPLAQTATTIVYNGNRSYNLTFPGVDYTDRLTPGHRLRTVRTVAAPNQSTLLNGSSQYYSKSSPAGMSFTNNFVVVAAAKPSSYTLGTFASRYNGTSGWSLRQLASGQVELSCYNAGAANFFKVTSYQSLPILKWTNNIAVQVDMTVTTNTPTTNYIMIDGIDVPALCTRGGTNPTAFIQAGNLEIGSENGGTSLFTGKLAQVAIFNAKVTQATMRGYISQSLLGTETSLISAYSFNNTVNDLNTTNANNLTANGSAVATNADSPFGTQGSGLISTTIDYGIVQSATYGAPDTTVVVQVPEGCTIPTSGGITSISYSAMSTPYGFPRDRNRWRVRTTLKTQANSGVVALAVTVTNTGFQQISVPIGKWKWSYSYPTQIGVAATTFLGIQIALSSSSSSIFDPSMSAQGVVIAASNGQIDSLVSKEGYLEITATTTYYMVTKSTSAAGTTQYLNGSVTDGYVEIENTYL